MELRHMEMRIIRNTPISIWVVATYHNEHIGLGYSQTSNNLKSFSNSFKLYQGNSFGR